MLNSILTVTAPASSRLLTTLDNVKASIDGISAISDDSLELLIKRASAAVEKTCNRIFARQSYSELWRPMTCFREMTLRQYPAAVTSVTENGNVLTTDDYEVDVNAGTVYRLTGNDQPSIWEASKIVIAYDAGFILPPDEAATLPSDLEFGVIETIRDWIINGDRNYSIQSETVVGVTSVTYQTGGTYADAELPSSAMALVQPYIRAIV